ncbi:DUF502 domain-containing protein [Viridibacterium curvum]|uniref:DUF502 domain-containing protein n=1 Tax=Viridibacterium curvum TaxID=1101404 RepID=A0ABP9Q7P4_9RHOO
MKKYLITGLLVWVPLAITVWVLQSIVGTLDRSILLLPEHWRPTQWLGFEIWGLGALLTILAVLLTGVIASNFFGARILRFWEGVLTRIPVVKSIYSSVKQVSDTLLGPGGQAFRDALLVQYPRAGSWTIAFRTGSPAPEIAALLPEECVNVYVPTTPNPTSGFFLMVPKKDIIELDISVDAALKHIISMGVVPPEKTSEPH